jgi:hypothetical protein
MHIHRYFTWHLSHSRVYYTFSAVKLRITPMLKTKVPQLNIGLQHPEVMFAGDMLNLPPQSHYGNLANKYLSVVSRMHEANRQIGVFYESWDEIKHTATSGKMILPQLMCCHRYAGEYAVTQIRRIADELITLVWCIDDFRTTRSIRNRLKIDAINGVTEKRYLGPYTMFSRYANMLSVLNDISNAIKHSFVDSDSLPVSRDEPMVIAMNMKMFIERDEPNLHWVSFTTLCPDFSEFVVECKTWLASHGTVQALAEIGLELKRERPRAE